MLSIRIFIVFTFLLFSLIGNSQSVNNLRQVTSSLNAIHFCQTKEIGSLLALEKKGSPENNPRVFRLYFSDKVVINPRLAPAVRPRPKNPSSTIGYEKLYGQTVISQVNFPPYISANFNYNTDYSQLDTIIISRSSRFINNLQFENDLLTSYSTDWRSAGSDFRFKYIWPERFPKKRKWRRTETIITYNEESLPVKIMKTSYYASADAVDLIDTLTIKKVYDIFEFTYDLLKHNITRTKYNLKDGDTTKLNLRYESLTIASKNERDLFVKRGKDIKFTRTQFNDNIRPVEIFYGDNSDNLTSQTSLRYDPESGCCIQNTFKRLIPNPRSGNFKKIIKYGFGPKFDANLNDFTDKEHWRVLEITEAGDSWFKVFDSESKEARVITAVDEWCDYYYRYKKLRKKKK